MKFAMAHVDGIDLHYAEVGSATDRPPVVLLHGLNDSHRTWKNVAPELARGRRVLMLDLPGHGLSARPDASYELPWYARVVRGWLEKLELEKADFVGHSLGGGIAQMLLLECRPRVRRVVLAASGGLGRDIAFAMRLASVPGVVEHFGQPFMRIGTRLALKASPGGLSREDIDELCRMNARRGTARAFGRTVRDLIDWRGQRRGFFQRAHEIADLPPIAIVWGANDPILPAEHGRALARALEGVSYTELPDCGHYLHHDDPVAFVQAVRAALDAPYAPRPRLRAAKETKVATAGDGKG